MSEDIYPGDTVVVVRGMPCCGGIKSLGMVFQVAWSGVADGPCHECGSEAIEASASHTNDLADECYPLVTLKKIPPLNELEEQTEERKVEV